MMNEVEIKINTARRHYFMAMAGGYVGVYCIWARKGIFALAQTANMIYCVTNVLDGGWKLFALRIFAVGFTALAVSLSVLAAGKGRDVKKISILLMAGAVILEGLIPETVNELLALYPLFFASAFQWCSYSDSLGYGSSTVFSTNNLRQCVSAYTQYYHGRDLKNLEKARFFRNTLLYYYAGVAVSYTAWKITGNKSVWFCLIPLWLAWKRHQLFLCGSE